MLEQWLLIAAVVLIGATIQSATGFGFGVLVVPTLVYMQVDPATAVMLILLLVTPVNIMTYLSTRKHVGHLHLLPFVILVLLVQPFGVWLLEQIKQFSRDDIKAFFGVMILVVLTIQWLLKVKPRAKLHSGWGVLAFTASGLMGGTCGMHGPPLAIWTTAHIWSSHRIRGSMMFCFLVWGPFLITNYYLKFPEQSFDAIKRWPTILPVSLMGLWLGLYLGKRISRPVLRVCVTVMLIIVSILAIFG
ncbi:MAG TPA: hypothetical protein DCM28_19970 [Phycisphaerales bacterium]|nr:hypothetical protein [Phycisphaerales bacterium]HCD35340.1 hypothetical protein [Phycisphaerales bacterium]|tara:strand:- start:129 stop:866 length:738 start_codon:yes stop_codon:yes gene_type:complete